MEFLNGKPVFGECPAELVAAVVFSDEVEIIGLGRIERRLERFSSRI